VHPKKRGWLVPAFIWWATVAVLIIVVVFPSLALIINSFKADGTFSLANYKAVFSDPQIRQSMLNSAKVVLSSTLLSTVLGVFLAWAVVRTDVPGKRYWQRLLSIPYFIPPFIGAISWTFLLGPVGYVNKLLASLMGVPRGPIDVYSIGGMIFVLSIYRYAVPFMVVVPTMRNISASVEEAARMSGASSWRTLRDVTLPLITPSILGAMLLTFMFILADFGVSAVLGAPDQIRLMTTQIYYLVNRSDLPNNLQIASAYSIFLSLFGLVGLWIYNRVLSTDKYSVVSGKSAPVEPTKLNKSRWPLFVALLVIFLFTTCAPVIATLVTSFTKTWGLPFSPSNMSLNNFKTLLEIQNIRRAFGNSFFLAITSALIITVITLIIGYITVRKGVRGVYGAGFMRIMVTLPYAVPGTIIALAMILAFSQPMPVTGWRLYNTIWILLIAYIARFLNLGYNNITGSISQIDISLEEAARMSGASHFKSLLHVTLPLLRSSLIGSFFLVIAPTLSEVTLSGLLWSVGNETIGTVVYATQEEGRVLRAAALAIVLIIVLIVINLFIQGLSERSARKGKQRLSGGI
jgi:iron(III) transport system permease protein